MKLISLQLENFQGIRSLRLNFDGKNASIYGDNATGKTTVYNAFTWLLFGRPSTGAKNYTPKPKNADGDAHNIDSTVIGAFDVDGRVLTLKKVYKEIYKKRRGSAESEFSGNTTEYYIDGVPSTEKDFAAMVEDKCGAGITPMLLTMPDYFADTIPWDQRRKTLLDICGDVTDAEIIAGNRELADLPYVLMMPGTSGQAYTVDEYQKIASARKTEINRTLDALPGRIDEAQRAMPDTAGMDEASIRHNIADYQAERDEIANRKASLAMNAAPELQRNKAELATQIAQEKSEHIRAELAKNAEIDRQIAEAESVQTKASRASDDLNEDMRRAETRLAMMQGTREKLIAEYNEISRIEWDAGKEICPTCHRPLPMDKTDQMREEFNLEKSARLEAINRRGKAEASRQMISDLKTSIEEIKQNISTVNAERSAAEATVTELNAKRTCEVLFEATDRYASLTAKNREICAMIESAQNCTSDQAKALDDDVLRLCAMIEDEQSKLSALASKKRQEERITELEAQEKALAAEFEKLERGLHLCDLFTRTKVSALTDRINGKFKRVRFRLFVEQINGGLKPDCEVLVPSAEGNLVPYSTANNAGKINAGMEIIGTLSKHYKKNLPVFVDNAESVTRLAGVDTQIIRLVVSENDNKLRMEI